MTEQTRPEIAIMDGAAALPRRSGELVFHDEWERRAFAMAVSLCEQGQFEWDEFRDCLIAEIRCAESAHAPDDTAAPGYYEHWLKALEAVLERRGHAVSATL
jgi:nitrile hydratase accessory protein